TRFRPSRRRTCHPLSRARSGSGLIGVGVGFGAQTPARDVISGIFYLLDDVFRVSEYIQSGSCKGTVGSLSLCSVTLRHHRKPV
ncbi:mechanosensitive ion channel domain-containing protein, partial [Microvirga aerophila]|uniref:mechanosensitive ion channel domain-containing protein n=1 Tax=Microvirga aerophila TaxID=670291 RepID=UPI0035A2300C